MEAGEMNPWVTCLSGKHEDRSSDPSSRVKGRPWRQALVTQVLGVELETGGSWDSLTLGF